VSQARSDAGRKPGPAPQLRITRAKPAGSAHQSRRGFGWPSRSAGVEGDWRVEQAELAATSQAEAEQMASVSRVAKGPRWRAGWPASVIKDRRTPAAAESHTVSALTEAQTHRRPSGSRSGGSRPGSIGRPRTGRDSRADRPGLAPDGLQRTLKGVRLKTKPITAATAMATKEAASAARSPRPPRRAVIPDGTQCEKKGLGPLVQHHAAQI